MCTIECIYFGARNLSKEEVAGKRVLEIGSYNVNGSLRQIVQSWGPAEYIGVDIEKGPGVDVVCKGEDLLQMFGKESFDIVLCTEVMEHVVDWKKIISIIKNICRKNGTILLTTVSYGFRYHPYPIDLWRYEKADLEAIFGDCEIQKLEGDSLSRGVYIKVRKPENFTERDLSDYKLYNMIVDQKISGPEEINYSCMHYRNITMRNIIRTAVYRVYSGIDYRL
jgi:SAM-dependent methyltransferase